MHRKTDWIIVKKILLFLRKNVSISKLKSTYLYQKHHFSVGYRDFKLEKKRSSKLIFQEKCYFYIFRDLQHFYSHYMLKGTFLALCNQIDTELQ